MGNHGKLEPQPQAPRGAAKLWSCGRMSDPHFTPPGFSLLFPRFYSYIPPQNGSIYGQVEHVRLCCLLCLLYLAESGSSQRAIAQEKAESPGNLWIWGHLGRWKSDSWEIWQSPDSEHPSGCEDVVDGLRKRDPHRSHRECSEGQFFFFLEGQAAKLITELSGQTIEAGDFYFDPHILTR